MPDDASITTAPETTPAQTTPAQTTPTQTTPAPIPDDEPAEPAAEPATEPAAALATEPATEPGLATGSTDLAAGVAPDPDPERLELIAAPAVLRRAPKFGAFVRTGVLTGAVVGIVLAGLVRAPSGGNRSAAIVFTAFGLACLGALLGAGAAVLADRRSTHR